MNKKTKNNIIKESGSKTVFEMLDTLEGDSICMEHLQELDSEQTRQAFCSVRNRLIQLEYINKNLTKAIAIKNNIVKSRKGAK